MPRPMDVFMGVVSYHMQSCYQHKINPDLDELERYNKASKQDDCQHKNQRRIYNDENGRSYYDICVDCEKSARLPRPEFLDGKPWNESHEEWWI